MLTIVVIVQDLYCRGKQRANLVPDPRSPICNHTEAYLRFRNQPSSFHLPERDTQFRIGLYLLPTQDVFDPRLHEQVQSDAFRLSPFVCPLGALGTGLLPAPAPAFRAPRAGRHISAINGQQQDRPPRLARRDHRELGGDLLACGCHIQHAYPLGDRLGHLVSGMCTHGQAVNSSNSS